MSSIFTAFNTIKNNKPIFTVYESLGLFGFETEEQKQALRFLMQKAGITDTDAILYNEVKDQMELARSILTLVRKTQNNLTIRIGRKERWEVENKDWMKEVSQQEQIIAALRVLQMFDAITPRQEQYDAICILGATRGTMITRVEYAAELFEANKISANWLITLTGERYVTPDKNGVYVDGSEQQLGELADKLHKEIAKLTETDLMLSIYQASKLYGKLPNTLFIDTPGTRTSTGEFLRPTTETTVTDLCVALRAHPEIKNILMVSSQPHCAYQETIINEVFARHGIKIVPEVIGTAYSLDGDNLADKINRVVQSVGSNIWIMAPKVLQNILADSALVDSALVMEYEQLYAKNPLMFQAAPSLALQSNSHHKHKL